MSAPSAAVVFVSPSEAKEKEVKANFCGQSDALTTRPTILLRAERRAWEGGITRVADDCVFSPTSRVLFSKSELVLYETSMEGEEWRTMTGPRKWI